MHLPADRRIFPETNIADTREITSDRIYEPELVPEASREHSLFEKYMLAQVGGLLETRFRITNITGLEEVLNLEGGFAVLAPHPGSAETLELLILAALHGLKLRPIAESKQWESWMKRRMLGFVDAIPIENGKNGVMSPWTQDKLQLQFDQMEERMKLGEHVLLFPAGKHRPYAGPVSKEDLGNARSPFELWSRNPNRPIVLTRIIGRASTSGGNAFETKRDLAKSAIKHAPGVISHWMTEREYPFHEGEYDFKILHPGDIPLDTTSDQLNRIIEEWMNGREEIITPLSHSATFKNHFKNKLKDPEPNLEEKLNQIPEILQHEVQDILCEINKYGTPSDYTPESKLQDLGLSSLDLIAVTTKLLTKYKRVITWEDLITVMDVMEVASGLKGEENELPPIPAKYFESDRPLAVEPFQTGSSILNTFKNGYRMIKQGNPVAVADDSLQEKKKNPLNYKEFLIGVQVLAEQISKLPGKKIGVVFPPTAPDLILKEAIQLAGKELGAFVNLTADASANDIVQAKGKLDGMDIILSSNKFLGKFLGESLSDSFRKQIVPIEVLQNEITTADKFKAKLRLKTHSPEELVHDHFGVEQGPEDPAFAIYTSGTTGTPKEIIHNHHAFEHGIAACFDRVKEGFDKDTVLQIPLPEYHIFGMVLRQMAINTGIKAVFYNNPTDPHGMAENIERYKVTMTAMTPDMFAQMLKVAPEKLKSLKTVLLGAAKVPQSIIDWCLKNDVNLIEGYGLSETMILTTGSKSEDPDCGVGKPLDGITITIADPDDPTKELEPGKEGMILAEGPTIFKGYVENHIECPFVTKFLDEGRRVFITGDIGYIDEKGNLHITGRTSRFAKIGGEKVPLEKIEEAIKSEYSPNEDGPQFAIDFVNNGQSDNDTIILYSTNEALTREEANRLILKVAQLDGKSKVKAIQRVSEIPIVGAGKPGYKKLKNALTQEDISNLVNQASGEA